MNPERLLMMFLRPLIRRLVNRGVDAGIDRVAGKGKSRDEMTPAERQQAKQAREMSKRAKLAMRITRRMR
ncbi:MAG: hypothetical protein P8X66_15430 [Maritimibacter sp.]